MYKYSYNTQLFKDRSREAMYISGLASADGCMTQNNLTFKLNVRDVNILEKMRDCVCPKHPLYDYMKHDSCMILQFGGPIIRDMVREIISDHLSNP